MAADAMMPVVSNDRRVSVTPQADFIIRRFSIVVVAVVYSVKLLAFASELP